MTISDKELVAHVEDVLAHGPLRRFDRVFYHGTLYTPGSDIGRILLFDEDGEYAHVQFSHSASWCWVGNLTRARKEE